MSVVLPTEQALVAGHVDTAHRPRLFAVYNLCAIFAGALGARASAQTGAVFFAAGLLGGCSQLLAPKLAARFGLLRTMVFTHLPANARRASRS